MASVCGRPGGWKEQSEELELPTGLVAGKRLAVQGPVRVSAQTLSWVACLLNSCLLLYHCVCVCVCVLEFLPF